MNYSVYLSCSYLKLFCDRILRTGLAQFSHLINLKLGEFSVVAFVATLGTFAFSFLRSVLHVLNLGSDPEMGRINAGRIITTGTIVKDKQSFWNWPKVNHPRSTACQKRHSVCSFSFINLTIAMLVFARYPNPTRFGLCHLFPKAFCKGGRESLINHPLRSNVVHRLVSLPVVDSRSLRAFLLYVSLPLMSI